MNGKISIQSKSFIVLFAIALFGTFVCLNLSINLINPYNSGQVVTNSRNSKLSGQANTQTQAPPIDTTGWKTYTNQQYGISFLYKPDWKILDAKTSGDYTVIQVDPGKKFYNIKIYVSTKDYYIMSGLPVQNCEIGGKPATQVNSLLYGVKNGSYYYTFDVGLSTSLKPDFDAMVNSVQFSS